MNAIRTIARLEFSSATRQRWVRVFAVAFALLTVVVAASAGAVEEGMAPEGFARTTVALVPLVLLLVPLVALLLGVCGQTGEAGSEAFLFAQPVARWEVLVGKWVGGLGALAAALAVGLGAGGAFLAAMVGPAGLGRFLVLLAASVALGAVFLALGAAVASVAGRRATAIGVAAFLWFFFALLYDGIALGVAGLSPGRTGARILFGSVFGNPGDLARVLTLTIAGTPHILGAAGEAWSRFLGGAASAIVLAGAGLAFWIFAPLEVARRWTAARDL